MQTSHISASPGACKAPAAGAERAVAPAAAAGADSSSGSVRQTVLRVVAAQVLGALTSDTGGLRGLRSREGNDARDPSSADAVARTLKSAAAQGSDPQALMAKVQTGIENAQTALAERGFDPAQVAAAAAQFTDRVASLMDAPASDPAPAADALAASLQVARKERGSLVLTTQDGDVLRIRFRNSERQKLELASVATQDAQAASVQLSSRERSRTRVEVEGSLDAGELKAIEDFVSKVDMLANEFFEGDVESAFAAAASLDYDGSEIAGFSLKLSMSEKVRASAVYTMIPGAGHAAGMQPTSSAPAAAAQQEPAAAAESEPQAAAADSTPPAAPSAVAGDPLRTVQDFMQRMLQTADAPLSVGGFKLAWSAKVRLAAEVVSVAAPAAAEKKPGAALLSNALDDAATQAGADAPQVKLAEAA